MNLPNYEDLGFNKFLERQISSQNSDTQQGQVYAASSNINFDDAQTSGSLVDIIQVGNIKIDGSNGRIEMTEDGDVVLLIGKDYE